MTGTIRLPVTFSASATSEAVQTPAGMILVGISVPELTSTSFTVTSSKSESGTYRTLKDTLGIYATAGTAVTFTMGSTSLGVYWIPPALSAVLDSWLKIVCGSTETAGIELIFRNIA